MKFFLISENGDAGGVARQLQREGNQVQIYFKNSAARQTLKGIIPQVASIRLGLNESPDVIFFDMVGQGKLADKLRDDGHKVLGGGEWNDKLELDRKFSMKTMDSLGVRSPRSFAFPNMKSAVEFAETHKKLLVLKPFDNKNTAFTFVPKSQDQLIGFMLHLKKDRGVDGKILLQEFVDGTEVSTEVWYSLGKPVPMPNSTFETKHLMHGNVGPSTGSQVSVVFGYPKREPKIVQQSLKKLSLFMERIRYTGPLDINGIVRKGRFWGLEFTPRLGYNAIYAWMRILNEPLGEVFRRLVEGDRKPISLKEGFGYAMRVSIPPYPFQPEDKEIKRKVYAETRNQAIGGLNKGDMEKVFPLDVFNHKGFLYTAGFDGVVAEVTGYGLDTFEAEQEAVRLFRKMELPQKQARLGDGARSADKRMFEMKRQGYEVPPFEVPKPIEVEAPIAVGVFPRKVEVKDEKQKEAKDDTLAVARKLNVKPGALADPIVKGEG